MKHSDQDHRVPPAVLLYIGGSWIARDQRGEIIETVETLPDGTPDWDAGGACDHRGAGGARGFLLLSQALDAAEENARLCGFEDTRLPEPSIGGAADRLERFISTGDTNVLTEGLDPVCMLHGKRQSEHACLYCALCFKDLEVIDCNLLPDGTREDVCHECARAEEFELIRRSPAGTWVEVRSGLYENKTGRIVETDAESAFAWVDLGPYGEHAVPFEDLRPLRG